MKMQSKFLASAMSLAVLALLPFPVNSQCVFEKVTFNANFPGGKLDECEQVSDRHYVLTTKPENTPINSSPWFAFMVNTDIEQTLTLSIRAQNTAPRYAPKISQDGRKWSLMPFDVDDFGTRVVIKTTGETSLYVSANELLTKKDYDYWIDSIAESNVFQRITIGQSKENRNIDALIYERDENKEWLVILGRQHPPELTGAFAFKGFINEMVNSFNEQEAFFSRFNVLAIPLVNPDGVERGFWRHNAGGIDLNRDWGKFTQPETKVIFNALSKKLIDDHRLVFALDFHSTQQDIFYTMPHDYGLVPANFVVDWLSDIDSNIISSFTVRDRPGSSPGRGVFKQFIADTYGVHAVTFEMGDNTLRPVIDHVAATSAKTLMRRMVNTSKASFIPTTPPPHRFH